MAKVADERIEIQDSQAIGPPSATGYDAETTNRIPLLVRALEISVAIIALVIFAPIMVLEALIIRWGTPGPVLFFQKRVGINGKLFWFVKFRTLYADAKTRFPELYAYRYSESELRSIKFKVENDPRVTPQGQWLRKTSLDELPNFWNVLTGDMALVGPRPEIPEMLPYYDSEMRKKFSVRPGITGLAQISGRGRLGFRETVALDLQYVNTRSFAFDLNLILKTIYRCLKADGAF
jgi:lipopolysaccharide/colanic/teichoic acid biosynthesis glycosyltransferase